MRAFLHLGEQLKIHLAEIDRQRIKAFSTRQGDLAYERALKSLLFKKGQEGLKWSVALAR